MFRRVQPCSRDVTFQMHDGWVAALAHRVPGGTVYWGPRRFIPIWKNDNRVFADRSWLGPGISKIKESGYSCSKPHKASCSKWWDRLWVPTACCCPHRKTHTLPCCLWWFFMVLLGTQSEKSSLFLSSILLFCCRFHFFLLTLPVLNCLPNVMFAYCTYGWKCSNIAAGNCQWQVNGFIIN